MTTTIKDRRSTPRQKSFLQGRIYFNGRRSSADCLIRDITDAGARLRFSGSVTVPEVFELYIPNKQETLRAHIKWHRGDDVGVEFENVPRHVDSPQLVPSANALEERVSKLERELAALRRRFEADRE
ncbi:MAG: PilZ domain-containing protein [Pseudorhodoplanes sp.]|nr:MAG: PilZ domain-containing protein [Pseudorhodoplanes sp.]